MGDITRNISMKTADLSNPCRPTYLSRKWATLLCEEYHKQGDTEKSMGMEITPMMDRNNFDLEKMQIGFIDIVVLPLYYAWAQIAPKANECLDQLKKNKDFWQEQEKKKKKIFGKRKKKKKKKKKKKVNG